MNEEWAPEKYKIIQLLTRKHGLIDVQLGMNGYRFYVRRIHEGNQLPPNGPWESCLEYKHDFTEIADDLARHLWEKA